MTSSSIKSSLLGSPKKKTKKENDKNKDHTWERVTEVATRAGAILPQANK